MPQGKTWSDFADYEEANVCRRCGALIGPEFEYCEKHRYIPAHSKLQARRLAERARDKRVHGLIHGWCQSVGLPREAQCQ